MVIDVIAAGLHPRVRSQADGSHYTSTDELPLVPGIDGVGAARTGSCATSSSRTPRWARWPDRPYRHPPQHRLARGQRPHRGRRRHEPGHVRLGRAAPAVRFQAGQNVLVLGATGNAGQMAVQVAKLFGADQIIAAGRSATAGWPARTRRHRHRPARRDAASVAQRLGRAAAEVDVVIDYLWGNPPPPRWSPSSPTAPIAASRSPGSRSARSPDHRSIPSAALRAARLQIVGSGQGSVSTREFLTELPALAQEITKELSRSTRGPRHSPRSNRPGPTPPTRHSASFSPRSPNLRETSRRTTRRFARENSGLPLPGSRALWLSLRR